MNFFIRCTMLWNVITSDDVIMLSYKNGMLDGSYSGNSSVMRDLHHRLGSFIKSWLGQYKHNHSTDEAD